MTKQPLRLAAALFSICLWAEALDSDAWGVRIGQAINPRLGGTRIGPYTLHGKLRGIRNAAPLTIVLDTDIIFEVNTTH